MDDKYNSKIFELNLIKVRVELARLNKNQAWLAAQVGETRQRFNYYFLIKSLKHVDQIAKVLGINTQELISAKIDF